MRRYLIACFAFIISSIILFLLLSSRINIDTNVILAYTVIGIISAVFGIFSAQKVKFDKIDDLKTQIYAIEYLYENRHIGNLNDALIHFFDCFDDQFNSEVLQKYEPYKDHYEIYSILKRYLKC